MRNIENLTCFKWFSYKVISGSLINVVFVKKKYNVAIPRDFLGTEDRKDIKKKHTSIESKI